MKCLIVGACAVLLLQVAAGRDLPFRRNSVAGKRQQQLNSPFNLRQAEPPRYQGNSQEEPADQEGYYGPEAADDYDAGSQQEDNQQGGPQFGLQPQGSDEGAQDGAGGQNYDFADFQGFGQDSLPKDISMKFEGPLPELNDNEGEKSQGFIFGAPAGFPSLNDFGGFQGKFGDDAPQQASDEGNAGAADEGGLDGSPDYGDEGSEEYNSPVGGGRPGGAGPNQQGYGYERQLGGGSHFAPGRPHAFVDSAPSPDANMWAK